jgi:hypothetical protein
MKIMDSLNDVLTLDPVQWHAHWTEIDKVIRALPSSLDQIQAWHSVCERLSKIPDPLVSLKGHPYFRLGILHLAEDADEQKGFEYLEQAYAEDKKRVRLTQNAPRPEECAAYRLLAIAKDFFAYLGSKKPTDWENALLLPVNRRVMIPTLFGVYDLSTTHILDMPGFTTKDFQRLIKNNSMRVFAGESYFCAERLLTMFTLEGQHIDRNNDQYPLGRATVGLIGGVLEAIWLDRLTGVQKGTLGQILKTAHEKGLLQPNSRLAALSSLLCFMRNHLHPGLDVRRLHYFIDMNVAKGCKIALDITISDLLNAP